jgi:hypothetical protein
MPHALSARGVTAACSTHGNFPTCAIRSRVRNSRSATCAFRERPERPGCPFRTRMRDGAVNSAASQRADAATAEVGGGLARFLLPIAGKAGESNSLQRD